MKKNRFYLLAAMATAVISLSSCIYDDEVATAPSTSFNSDEEVQITATMQGINAGNTRAAYNLQSDNLNSWTNAGIYVFKTGATKAVAASTGVTGYAGYNNLQVTGTTPTTVSDPPATTNITLSTDPTKLYFPVDNTDVDAYVYAPYAAANKADDIVKAMPVTVADDQTQDASYIASDFIYGKATASYTGNKTASVTMYHAMTKMTFKIVDAANGTNAAGITEIKLTNVFKSATVDMSAAVVASPTAATDPYLNNGSNVNVTTTTTGTRGDVIVAAYDPSGSTAAHTTNFYTTAKNNGVSAVIPPHSAADLQNSSASPAAPVQVSVTIDGKTKTAEIYQSTGTGALTELLPGFEYIFTLNIKATGIIIVAVAIKPWQSGGTVARDLTF